MILLNELEKETVIKKADYEKLLLILAPFAPHFTDELWSVLGHKKSINIENWPKYNETKITEASVTIVVQVNGKMRATFEAEQGISDKDLEIKSLAIPEVKKWTDSKEIKKVIVIKNKIVNIVV